MITNETRRDAYEAAKPKITNLQAEVLKWIKALGPCTTRAVAKYEGSYILTVRPRFTELKQAGLIKAVGRNAEGALWVALTEEELAERASIQPELNL